MNLNQKHGNVISVNVGFVIDNQGRLDYQSTLIVIKVDLIINQGRLLLLITPR